MFPSAETRGIFSELLTEGLEPHKVKEVLISGAVPPDTWIDISDTLEVKCRRAQGARLAGRARASGSSRCCASGRCATARTPGVAHAEAYRRMVLWR